MRINVGRITTALTGVAATLLGATAGAAVPTAMPPGTQDDSYIVVLRPGARLSQTYGVTIDDTYTTAVTGFHARMTATQAARVAADPAVRYIEPDAVVRPAAAVAWGVDRLDQRTLPLSKSKPAVPSAAGVTVYVLDSGIRAGHREFAGRARNGWDFVDDDAVAEDCNGHGTHVAGSIAGTTTGVAPDAKLVGVRVLDCRGAGSFSKIIAGIDWVIARATGPTVVNLSLGGNASKAMDDAVNRAMAKGITFVAAAGNDNRDACQQSPARAPGAITVGATDDTDTRWSKSNYGSCLDIFAPGVRISSADSSSATGLKLMSGTSMASPHVAGAAALVLAAHPDWTPARVRDELIAQAGAGQVRSPGSKSPNRLLYTGFLAAPVS